MCGRYAASRSPEDLVKEFEVVEDAVTPERTAASAAGESVGDYIHEPIGDYNAAPTKACPVVLQRTRREDRDGEAVRWLRLLTWGLVPSWAKDRSVGNRMINARAETLLDKSAYRRAALARRCLVPADGWFEWQASPVARGAKGKPRKQPFFVTAADGDVLALAGVYELWRDESREADDPFAWLTTYAVVTTQAEEGLDRIHDRMPLVLPRELWSDWLDPEVADPDAVRALLQPRAAGRFVARPVSTLVNDVRNNGPELLDPVPREDLVGVVDPETGEVLGGQDASLF